MSGQYLYLLSYPNSLTYTISPKESDFMVI